MESTLGKGLWYDSLGREVDIADIDKEYALNILSMHIRNRFRAGLAPRQALVDALRETIVYGREPNEDDRRRAARYNKENAKAGLKFRAPVEDPKDAYPAPVGTTTGRFSCARPNLRPSARVVVDGEMYESHNAVGEQQ